MPKHDGWAAVTAKGKIIAGTFGLKKEMAEAAFKACFDSMSLAELECRIIRVRLVPADPPRRERRS